MRVDLSTLCLLIISFGSLRATDDEPAKAHVAIVGAGIAGISTAYWLKYYLNDSIAITIYENDRVGGRLETLAIDGVEYEAGGSIIHEKNLYMKRFTEELGLKPIESESSGAYFMTDNGENVLFSTLSKYIPKVFLLLWRYRFDAIRLKFWLSGKLSNFVRIYDYQDNGRTFDTVEEFLKLLDEDFYTSTRMSFRKYLFEKGFHKDFINELAQVAALVNYDQSVDTMNGFPGLVSLMAAGSSLWHVEGGNKLVPKKLLEKLLQLPNVQFVQGHVKSVEEIHRRADDDDQGGAIRLAFQPANSELVHSVSYDSVILAFPLHRDNVNDFHLAANEEFQQENFRMQPTHANFVHGQYNCSAYGLTVDECARLKAIFFINPSFPFRSVAEQQSTVSAIKPTKKDQRAIYKVFSPGPLSSDHFQRIFDRTNYELVRDFPWLAYPRYNYPQKFPPIKLQKNLFYVNAMEWSASCMEIEAISARNIALLITKELGVKIKRTDKHSEF